MVENLVAPSKHNRIDPCAASLLAWYDRHGRDLPWRVKGGLADPYRVWLSEIMLQQTVVEAVKPYFARFLARWPDVTALASADEKEVLTQWAGLGYYARARNLIACARQVAASGGIFPDNEAELRALPGIGAYTAAAIAAIAFNRPAVVIDGNIERVITRVFAISTPLPRAKAEIRAALEPLVPLARPGDFAQALMDLGAGICTPRRPDCLICPLRDFCAARVHGNPETFPVKMKKKAKPVKFGIAWLIRDEAERILLGTRPSRGLLAKMAEVPNSGWAEEKPPAASPPLAARWEAGEARVTHVFTHFELRFDIRIGRVAGTPPAPAGLRWVEARALGDEPLPTLFKKVIRAFSDQVDAG